MSSETPERDAIESLLSLLSVYRFLPFFSLFGVSWRVARLGINDLGAADDEAWSKYIVGDGVFASGADVQATKKNGVRNTELLSCARFIVSNTSDSTC